MQRNAFDRHDCLELGETAEQVFAGLVIAKGWQVQASTDQQDIHEHWDYLICKAERQFRVDVKARKRIRRSDPQQQDDWLWIELHGVREHDAGWLYGGQADLLAFELSTGFLLVRRVDLIAVICEWVDFSSEVSSASQARYKLYRRANRHDCLTLIESQRLLELQHYWLGKSPLN